MPTAEIKNIRTTIANVRLKYLLGEIQLGNWRPKLSVSTPACFVLDDYPSAPEQLFAELSDELEGMLCRKVDSSRFPLGIGKYGDFLRYVPQADVLYYVLISGEFDQYIRKFSTKSRQNLTRSVRKFLEEKPGINRCEVFTTPEEVTRFHAEASEISKKTYQTRLLGSGLPATKGFLQAMCKTASEGRARGYLLYSGEQAIAFAWCRQERTSLVYDVVGYLPEFANASPGTVLLYLILQDLFQLRCYEILDFGPGEAQYKSMFSTNRQEFIDTYLFRSTLKNLVLVKTHYFLLNFSSTVGNALEKIGVKKKIKSFIRSLK